MVQKLHHYDKYISSGKALVGKPHRGRKGSLPAGSLRVARELETDICDTCGEGDNSLLHNKQFVLFLFFSAEIAQILQHVGAFFLELGKTAVKNKSNISYLFLKEGRNKPQIMETRNLASAPRYCFVGSAGMYGELWGVRTPPHKGNPP